MKKTVLITFLILLGLLVGIFIGIRVSQYVAKSQFTIAVVDVQKIISQSKELKDLKAKNEEAAKQFAQQVEQAKKALSEETDLRKKAALANRYNKELSEKKQIIETEYATKMQQFDKQFSNIIDNEAKTKGYDFVLVKSFVVSGGVEITDEISKLFN